MDGSWCSTRSLANKHTLMRQKRIGDHQRIRSLVGTTERREALYHLRARGEIGDEAFRRIQEELDWSELDAAPAGSFQSLTS